MSSPPTSAVAPWSRHAAAAVRDLRGGVRLLADALRQGIDRIEAAHGRIADVEPAVRGVRVGRPGSGVGAVVYRSLRGTTDLAGGALDLALASLQSTLVDPQRERRPPEPVPAREAAVAALNALVGDHLHRTDNPLALRLQLRTRGAAALPRVLVLVHDFGRNDLQWAQGGHDHGQALAEAFGCTPVYVLYNSGRPVAASGRELAAELEVSLAHWRVPLEGAVLVGHGLGGLVLRSALYQARHSGMAWPGHVRKLVFLGTPHHGAEAPRDLPGQLRLGPASLLAPLARLARRPSAGLRDLLDGRVLEDDPRTGLPAAQGSAGLPPGVPAYTIAGAIGDGRHDGWVPVASALGQHEVASRDLQLPPEHRWVIEGVDHGALLRSQAVFQKMRQWLAA